MKPARTEPSPALTARLSDCVHELRLALDGFPVEELVSAYSCEATSRPTAARPLGSFLLAMSCLSNWQSALDITIASFPVNVDDEHQRVRTTQQRARDALSQVESTLKLVEGMRSKAAAAAQSTALSGTASQNTMQWAVSLES